jgi:hypothetical protein
MGDWMALCGGLERELVWMYACMMVGYKKSYSRH